jgi:hypothetical protein
MANEQIPRAMAEPDLAVLFRLRLLERNAVEERHRRESLRTFHGVAEFEAKISPNRLSDFRLDLA